MIETLYYMKKEYNKQLEELFPLLSRTKTKSGIEYYFLSE